MMTLDSGAFLLSLWASMGTFFGGILVVFLIGILGADPKSPQTSHLMGILQSLSAGVMIHMTCFHLVPESNTSIGARETMIFFFLGVLAFGVLEFVIIPSTGHEHDDDDGHDHEGKVKSKSPSKRVTRSSAKKPQEGNVANISKRDALDLYRTSLITFIAMALHNIPEGISVYLTALSNPKMGIQLALAIMLHNSCV